ncbi:hypothetical protein UY3_05333 [Chelonia mydas]|uniref:Uncharacterized protein n=1 Tax=Chelonia mydas TaxID=8469 RepID=M7BP82_CHEMY|nr:hypothetical protein UY3_05333 [Chelonia mydas]
MAIPYHVILTSALLLAAALPSELRSWSAVATLQLPSSEGRAIIISPTEKDENSEVVKSADVTKLLKIVKSKADCKVLQRDLTKLGDWAIKW